MTQYDSCVALRARGEIQWTLVSQIDVLSSAPHIRIHPPCSKPRGSAPLLALGYVHIDLRQMVGIQSAFSLEMNDGTDDPSIVSMIEKLNAEFDKKCQELAEKTAELKTEKKKLQSRINKWIEWANKVLWALDDFTLGILVDKGLLNKEDGTFILPVM